MQRRKKYIVVECWFGISLHFVPLWNEILKKLFVKAIDIILIFEQ